MNEPENLIPLDGDYRKLKRLDVAQMACVVGSFTCVIFLCSCATGPGGRRALPDDVDFNKEAGRGGLLTATIQ